jgi:uncharacterized protein YjiK
MRHQAPATSLLALALVAPVALPAAESARNAASISAYLAKNPTRQFYLPEGLTEISGLAIASNDSLYAHDDNYAIVYEIALSSGKVLRAFALGTPTVKADFEDIAVRGGNVYLLTGDGHLFEAPIGAHRKRVLYNAYDTGVGAHCEAEGLANGPTDSEFLILCKTPHEASLKGRLVIYAWSLQDRAPVGRPWLNVALEGPVDSQEQAGFHPSAFVWRPNEGTFLIISAKGHSAIEIDRHGRLIDRIRLDRLLHPQPEALALMPDGRLVMGDEGSRGHGKLSIYAAPQ